MNTRKFIWLYKPREGDRACLWNTKASKDKDLIFGSESPWDVTRHRETLWGSIATCLHRDFFILFSSYLLLIMLKVGWLDRTTFVHPYALTQAMWTEKWQRFGNEPMARAQWIVCHRSVLPRYFKSLLWSPSFGPYTWSTWHLLEHGDRGFPCAHEEWYMCNSFGVVPEPPGWWSDQKHDGRERGEVTKGSGRAYNSANQSKSQAWAGSSTQSRKPTPAHPVPPLDCSCRCWVLCVCVWLEAAKKKAASSKTVVIKVKNG